jgi:hypothetical protein
MASVDHRDASTTHIVSAAKLFREWMSADAWVRHDTYQQEAVAAHKAPLTASKLRKRKSRSTGGSYHIVGQSIAHGGSTSTDCIPVTWLKEIARDRTMGVSPAKKSRCDKDTIPFAVSKKQLRKFQNASSSPMAVDNRCTPMDTSTNFIIQVNFAERKDAFLGFHVVDSVQRRSESFSREAIVPILKSVHPGSCAARVGLCSGMRIISIGTSTIRHAANMPVSELDYSPARRVIELINSALQSSFLVDFRVDKRS